MKDILNMEELSPLATTAHTAKTKLNNATKAAPTETSRNPESTGLQAKAYNRY